MSKSTSRPPRATTKRKTRHAPKLGLVHGSAPGLDETLTHLKGCIENGWDEDALMHLFSLIGALRLRAAIKGMRREDLTPEGHASLALLNAEVCRVGSAKNSNETIP